MPENTRHIDTELAIIGTGLAGIAAAIFARNRGISCAITGNTGALAYTTGYLDLLGCVEEKFIATPWEGLEWITKNNPYHPLAALPPARIRLAFDEFTQFISSIGIGYTSPGENNLLGFTPAGTIKPTLCVPQTMAKGVEALHSKPPCKIIGFHGLKGFSACQVAANLTTVWPGLQATTVHFPGHPGGELYAEVAARSLEVPENRRTLAELLKKHCQGFDFVGLPAVLGIHAPDTVLADLERLTGLSLFEIPTMPPSVPGIRLREIIEQLLPQKGAALIPQQKVKRLTFRESCAELELSDNHGPIRIQAQTVLLATGRFLSGGLEAQFDGLVEPLLNLPVYQPDSRAEWYEEEYLNSTGHKIHLAGIQTDNQFRPLDPAGEVFDQRLFAAGIVLAHQDWIRQRCGAGVAIASALAAVEAAQRELQSRP